MENQGPKRSIDGVAPYRSVDGLIRPVRPTPAPPAQPKPKLFGKRKNIQTLPQPAVASRQPAPTERLATPFVPLTTAVAAPAEAVPKVALQPKKRRFWRFLKFSLGLIIIIAAIVGIWLIYRQYYA